MRSFLAILFGLTLASGAAVAGSQDFDKLDKDDSGSLSRSEIAVAAVDFSDADADGNGKVSKSEYENAKKSGDEKEQGASTY